MWRLVWQPDRPFLINFNVLSWFFAKTNADFVRTRTRPDFQNLRVVLMCLRLPFARPGLKLVKRRLNFKYPGLRYANAGLDFVSPRLKFANYGSGHAKVRWRCANVGQWF